MADMLGGGLPSTPQQQDPATQSWQKFNETEAEISDANLKDSVKEKIDKQADATTDFAKAALKGKDTGAPYNETLNRDDYKWPPV